MINSQAIVSTIIWRRIDLPGHEIASLISLEDGWKLSGTAIFVHEENPCRLEYGIVCDFAWRTTLARVEGSIGNREIDITISVDSERLWRLNGVDCPSVKNCIDIDLGFSPATNLLPIRRLWLNVGNEADVMAAWLPFPSLQLEPLSQLYRRERNHTYRYESAGGQFVRNLKINGTGFVLDYPGLWQAECIKKMID